MRRLSFAPALTTLLACGGVKRGTLHQNLTLEHDGQTRSYHLYEPAQHDQDRPLVVVLHGGYGTNDGVLGIGLARSPNQVWLDIATEEDLFIAAPQGLNKHWNDCRPACERCGDEDDIGFLLSLIDTLGVSHDVDRSRVYVVGESNGGFMTQRVAMEAPDRLAGAGVINALIPTNHTCDASGQPVPIMYQVGTDDRLVLYDGGQSGDDEALSVLSAQDSRDYWVGVNECESTPTTADMTDLDPDDQSTVTRDDYACATTSAPVSMLHMRGAGHVPASIDVHVTAAWEALVGPQNHDAESARELWTFFDGLP